MSVIGVLANIAYFALLLYFVVLWVRFALDLVQAFSRAWRPHGAVLVAAAVIFTLPDPPIKLVRRILPPLRIGAFALDFGFTVVMFAVILLIYVASSVAQAAPVVGRA